MEFSTKPKTEKERIEQVVDSNARVFDNCLPARNFNL
jgi:hypothetical protein